MTGPEDRPMPDRPMIEARSVGKTYRVYDRPMDRVLELLTRRRRHRGFQALSGVSFQVARGEGLGIIGENGAGKSTLLKILSGIVQPTEGEAIVHGKVASILELSSGFHPEMTGRQNIVLNAAMLGLGEEELARALPVIIEFSELGDFIDQPVKTYSSGMGMRLGFAIATQVDPDVLIIDEALSVGDGYFQKKCMDRMLELTGEGVTLLFCSHAMYYVTAFCRRALWLKDGRVQAHGPVDEVVREYENFLQQKAARAEAAKAAEAANRPERADHPARIVRVDLATGAHYRHGDPLRLAVEWTSDRADRCFHLGVGINRADEVEVLTFGTHLDAREPLTGRLEYRLHLDIAQLPMVKGSYTLYVFLLDEGGLHIYDRRILPGAFEVVPDGYRFGLVEAPHAWIVDTGDSVEAEPTRRPALAAATLND